MLFIQVRGLKYQAVFYIGLIGGGPAMAANHSISPHTPESSYLQLATLPRSYAPADESALAPLFSEQTPLLFDAYPAEMKFVYTMSAAANNHCLWVERYLGRFRLRLSRTTDEIFSTQPTPLPGIYPGSM